MSTIVNIHEAKTHFSCLLVKVVRGEKGVIAKSGGLLAKLVSASTRQAMAAGPGSVASHALIGIYDRTSFHYQTR